MVKKEDVEIKGPQIKPLEDNKKTNKHILLLLLFVFLGLVLTTSLALNIIQSTNQKENQDQQINQLTQQITTLQEQNNILQEQIKKIPQISQADKDNLDYINKINSIKKDLKVLIETIDIESQKPAPDKNILKTKTEHAIQSVENLSSKLKQYNTFLSNNTPQDLNKELQIEINELTLRELSETKAMLEIIKNQIQ